MTRFFYSFDIFDTLITRKTANPKGIFLLIQKHIEKEEKFSKDFRNNFYKTRIESEKRARLQSKEREITFDEIYNKMQSDWNLENKAVDFLKNLEIQLEFENIIPIEENISILKNLINQNQKVVLISDMYFSNDIIKMFLENIDSIFKNIKIYVSSDFKKTKADGSLFREVQAKEKIKYKNWQHFGDNKNSDIKQAAKLGIKTVHCPQSALLEQENELLRLHPLNLDYQFLIAVSKILRMNKIKNNKEKYNLGASISAPFLYNYVNFVIENSINKGFETLYFIARDGYIPKIIADIIIKKRNLNLKTKYIYGSRIAWRIPDKNNYRKFVDMLLQEYPNKLSLSFIAYRLHIEVDELKNVLNFKGSTEKILNSKQLEKIKNKLLKNSAKQFVIEKNSTKADLLREYLKQETDLSKRDIAFIDINGSGRTQNILSDFINQFSKNTVHTFYVSTNLDSTEELSKKYTFCKKPKPHYHHVELLCRTLDGQTTGYEKKDSKIIPKLEDFPKQALLDWGYKEYLQSIVDYTNLALDFGIYSSNPDICLYVDYITSKCNPKTAQILGDIPFLTIGKETDTKKAAPEIPLLFIIFNFLLGKKISDITDFPLITMARGNKITNFVKAFFEKLYVKPNFLLEFQLFLKLKTLKSQKTMLWGASLFLEDFLKKYKIDNKNILGIIDKNPNRQGKNLGCYKIYSPDEIKNLNPDCIVLTIKNQNKFIYDELQKTFKKDFPNIKLVSNVIKN